MESDPQAPLHCCTSAISAYIVVVVDSGRAALEMLDADRAFDIVLMDLPMPEMGGIEAADIIRQRARSTYHS